MGNDHVAEIPDYDERTKTYSFTPVNQLHLRGPLSLAEAKKASVIELEASGGSAMEQELHAA